MKLTMNILLAAVAAMTLAAAGAPLDGPSDEEIAAAQAADFAEYKQRAQRFERDLRACKKVLGPTADLVEIAGSDDYVCREVDVEPTPRAVLGRYTNLSTTK
jgi:hypothetical protein